METFSLRRTQSLRSLSGVQESSWVVSPNATRNRKSVSQLVQQYQSCADLRSSEKAETKLEVPESCVDGRWRRQDSRETLWRSAGSSNLSRSRSMDSLSQREASGTRALCALFESKSTLQQDFNSSPRLNSQSGAGTNTGTDCPLQDWRCYNTPLKETLIQRTTQVDGPKVTNGLPETNIRASRHRNDDNYNQSLSKGGTQSRQTRDRISTSSSVRDRLALYLTRAAATDSTGGSAQPEFISTPGTKTKHNKMAEASRKLTSSQPCPDEDLPLPPPPPVPPRPLDYEGPAALSSLPVPPPKESFTTFYQQQQKNELKRLFKHIHPDLRASLDDAVDDEIIKVVQSESAQAADGSYQGEVQSMRWIFENWTLDNIGDPHETKKLLDTEELKGGDVRSTSSMFEYTDSIQHMSTKRQTSGRGDVRTSTWLFETQPLDSLSESKGEEGELVEAVLKEPLQSGDVRGTRLLFETKPLSDLGRCNSIEDCSFLKLKSELQEQRGDVQKTLKLFQTEPSCAIRDRNGNIHAIKSICREEINSGKFSTARWLFETQPLDMINQGSDGVKIIRGISLEEGHKGGVDQKRWMFETQPFDTIQEVAGVDDFEGSLADSAGQADVINKRKLFEVQRAERCLEKEAIVGGDVKTSLWLFETQPVDALSDSCEVGRLKKITLSTEEQGEVKCKKLIFENGNFQKNISLQEQEIKKGDVKGYKELFETIPLSKIADLEKEISMKEENTASDENVKDGQTPLYAIRDSSGNLHEVTTVSREELIKGKVKNYKWMFETKSLDQLTDGKGNVEVIKGITRQEVATGDVKMAKWLFETQTIDGIHCKVNQTEQSSFLKKEPCKGDVKTCKWLFETQPMDKKLEKAKDQESIDTNVKSITWLFESQPLDSIKDGEPYSLKLCSTTKDSVKSEVPVQTAKHLFETETLDRIRKDSDPEQNLKYISEVNFQSGDVSRVKELFESQSLDEIGSEIVIPSEGQNQNEHIEKGSVHKFSWMFENCPMNQINQDHNEVSTETAGVIERGDVQNKKFIFETSSLDKIHKEPAEEMSVLVEEPVRNVDVKSSSMMFESLPLYAIRDKEGQFHEVTTARKEEVMSGDVKGARWMFETKPLDAIKAENDVYVIRAVTQEDVKKGDVKSARWKFETQPLDSFTSEDEPSVRITEDIESSNVQLNKKMFESDQTRKQFVRMVSVTDVQRGDVRTSTWLFENQTLDSLKGEPDEQSSVKTVHREDSQKGDVKRCTWLFESQPLDKIKEPEDTSDQAMEEVPKADVKCTTWLFETTPLDKITASSVADTLSYLFEMNFVHSSGIIIEANEQQNVSMAKYLLDSSESVKVQKEDAVTGNIRNIMLQLLLKPTIKPQVTLLRETEKGNINSAVVELPVFESTVTNVESDQRIQNIVQTIDELLIYKKDFKKGIIMQETGDGRAEMSVYSLISNNEIKPESQIAERGDVKTTIGNLLATANSSRAAMACRVDENEKGNVNLYKSCIEKGDLQYLKSLHTEAAECGDDHSSLIKEQIETIQGGVKEAKRSLQQPKEQAERSICDVLPGDVNNTKKVFASECYVSVDNSGPKEEIIPGDILSAKQQLAVKQPVMVDKEEIVPGDIKATMESLERAKQQSMSVEREIIKPGTIYDMDLSAQGPVDEGGKPQKEVIISGDVRAAKKSLEMAKQQSLHLEREVIVPGKIYNLGVSEQDESSSTVIQSTCSSSSMIQQVKTYPKFLLPAKEMCSACLTPVYPVEKVVVNKVTLHYNCFCCKHCKKKLSTHNYSSLYGEFYCISHYRQLFKRKGNYDEGFGHIQHKDRWLIKDKAVDEPDSRSTPKITKNHSNTAADVVVIKTSTRELGGKGVDDVKGKLKISWPPKKKKTGVNPAQPTNASALKNKVSNIATINVESQSWDKLSHSREMRDRAVREQSKASLTSAEKMSSEKTSPVGHFQINTSPTESKVSMPLPENGTSVKNQITIQTRVAPTLKSIHHPVPNRPEASVNKHKKCVRFAPSVDAAQCDPSCQPSSAAESETLSDQSEQHPTNNPKDIEMTDSSDVEPVRNEHNESKGNLESESHKETSNLENEADMLSQEIPKPDDTSLTEVKEEVNDSQSLTETSSLPVDVRQPEPAATLDLMSGDPVSKVHYENPTAPQTPQEHVTKDEAGVDVIPSSTPDPINDQDVCGNKKKPIARTNSKTKLGSWSKGKSPLSKLFTSSGNEKTNRTDPKEAKKPDVKPRLLRLFQSSTDVATTPAQEERNTKTHPDDKSAEKEAATKDKQEAVSEVLPLKPDVAQPVELESSDTDAQESNCRSTEPTDHNQGLISEADPPTPDKNPADQESESQSNLVMSASDPEIPPGEPLSVEYLPHTEHDEPISESTPERNTDEILNNALNDDISGECAPSALGEVLVSADEFSPNDVSNKLPDQSNEEEQNLNEDVLFNLSNDRESYKGSDLFGPSSQTFSCSLTDSAEPAAVFTEDFNLMDDQPLSADAQVAQTMTDPPTVQDSAPMKQDDISDPFMADDLTSEQNVDFDIFSSNVPLFPPTVNVSDQTGASANLLSAFPDDIFGISDISGSADVFPVLPSSPTTSNSLNDLLGSDIPSNAAQVDLFTEDLFAPETQLLPMSEPINLLVSEESNAEQKSQSSSWMDDLLG